MDKIIFKANKRTVLGRKVKQLRKKGIIPANVYGKKVKSTAVQLDEKELASVYEKAGNTGLVELLLDKEKRPVLIHKIQYHPVTDKPLHVDFHQVDLKEKIITKVLLKFAGESIAVKDKLGTLLAILSEIEVEALPSDLPEKIEVDVSGLSQIDQSIKVQDLKVDSKVKILTDAGLDVVKIAPLVSKKVEEEIAKEEEEKVTADEEKKEEAAKEAEKPDEEAPTEKKPEEKGKPQEKTPSKEAKPQSK